MVLYTCEQCGKAGEDATCPSCLPGKVRRQPQAVPEIGEIKGPEFAPDEHRLSAMRDVLLPVPCQPLATDGWIVTCLETLEALAKYSDEQLSRKRDLIISCYRSIESFLESEIPKLLPRMAAIPRQVHREQHPWAYTARVSLITAMAKRLAASGLLRIVKNDILREIDRLSCLLLDLMPLLYTRDLFLAEIHCSLEYSWR